MKHVRIGLDFDDTLMPTRAAILDHLNALRGTKISAESLTEYRFVEQFGLSLLDYVAMFNEQEGAFHEREPLPGVLETLGHWQESCTFFVITGRPVDWLGSAERWLAKYGIPIAGIHSAMDGNKARHAIENQVTLFVEDNAEMALNLAENGIDVLLIDAPYNRYCSHPRITRVRDWFEIQLLTVGKNSQERKPQHVQL